MVRFIHMNHAEKILWSIMETAESFGYNSAKLQYAVLSNTERELVKSEIQHAIEKMECEVRKLSQIMNDE